MTPAGLQPQTPAALNAQLITAAQVLSPGLWVLPSGLINDISGTDTAALVLMDQARVDVINSVSPLGANPFIFYQLGTIYGTIPGQTTNASVDLIFTGSAAGFVIPVGFTVSDGSNQYVVQDGGIVGTGLQTPPLFAVASSSATFAIPAGSVTQLVTSVPSGYTLTVTNPLAGTPAQAAETISAYRARTLQAGLVASTGTTPFLKTLLGNITGVISNLISVRSVGSNWEIIVGGSGDPYQIAGAIFQSGISLPLLVGSTLGVANFTAANPGQVTTTLNHGYATGQHVTVAGATPTGYNAIYPSITVIDEKNFTVGSDTSAYGAWTGGGVVTPNFRNQSVTINNYPDNYTIPFVLPPAQAVTMVVTWNTISTNFVSATSVAQLSSAALSAYINGLSIGEPINVDVMAATFQTAIAAILSAQLISVLSFTVDINGVVTSPGGGTVLITGDPESYFSCSPSSIVVEQS